MSFKQILVLIVLAAIAIAVAYFTCGLGYVFAIVVTATFCWLVTFKMFLIALATIATFVLTWLQRAIKAITPKPKTP